MKSLQTTTVALFLALAGTASAQSILHPTIIGYSNQNPTHPPGNPMWLYFGGGTCANSHPDQFKPDGKNRALIHSVSPMGDLTHEGGARWILDIRMTGPYPDVQVNAMIARPETVASETNPTWYYVPAQDDPVDRVLLDTSVYLPERAQWSTQVAGGRINVGFFGTGPVAGQNKRGLFVGHVTWDASGPVGPMQDITLVVEGDAFDWKWGTANQLVFQIPAIGGGNELWLADVSGIPAVAPTVAYTGVTGAVANPALSRSGSYVAYVNDTATGRAIHVRAIATGATYTLPVGNVSSNSINGVEWSPDDQFIVFSARTPSNPWASVYKSNSSGSTNQPDKLTSTKTVNGVVVGYFHGSLKWRL